ncbi:hypothetical protein FKM82_002216 [Ascaphus truei]
MSFFNLIYYVTLLRCFPLHYNLLPRIFLTHPNEGHLGPIHSTLVIKMQFFRSVFVCWCAWRLPTPIVFDFLKFSVIPPKHCFIFGTAVRFFYSKLYYFFFNIHIGIKLQKDVYSWVWARSILQVKAAACFRGTRGKKKPIQERLVHLAVQSMYCSILCS